jgi:threonine aldolase
MLNCHRFAHGCHFIPLLLRGQLAISTPTPKFAAVIVGTMPPRVLIPPPAKKKAKHATDTPTRYSFFDDFGEGAHPDILEALSQTNMSQQKSYGDDKYCDEARKTIRRMIGSHQTMVHFTPGRTGATLLSITSSLRPHEAFVAAASDNRLMVLKDGGLVEAAGHKILVEPGVTGKLTPNSIQLACYENVSGQGPTVRMVVISNATELGTVYTRDELEAVAAMCKKHKLLLVMDGTRLGAAIASDKNDMTLKDFFRLTDIFWIGGTANGALLGDAIVIKDPTFGTDFQ